MANITLCPRCGGKLVPVGERTGGFSGKKAVAGAIIAGPAGVAAGALGKKLVTLQCEKCGYTVETDEKTAAAAERYGVMNAPVEAMRQDMIRRELEESLGMGPPPAEIPASSLGALLDAENQEAQRQQNAVIAISGKYVAAVREDGTVLITNLRPDADGQPDIVIEEVKKWENMIAVYGDVSFGTFGAIFGLRKDGRVKVAGSKISKEIKTEMESWKDIVSVSCGERGMFVVGLHRDGTVEITSSKNITNEHSMKVYKSIEPVKEWTDMISVFAASKGGNNYVLGLRRDGTVACAGRDAAIVSATSEWKHVVSLWCTIYGLAVGVRDDGYLYCAGGQNSNSTRKLKEEVRRVFTATAVRGLMLVLFSLQADGTVQVSSGASEFNTACTEGWRDIVAVESCSGMVIGLRCDGTLVVANLGQGRDSELKTWDNIRVLPLRKESVLFCSNMLKERGEKEKKRREEEQKRRKEEQKRQKEEQRHKWKEQGKCQYCGGSFSFFGKKCKNCGKPKDY